jgi:hypothetical protein
LRYAIDVIGLDRRPADLQPGCLAVAQIDQTSPHSYVCRPTRGLPRLPGTTVLYAQVHQGGVDLTGPASVINLVKKNLLTAK